MFLELEPEEIDCSEWWDNWWETEWAWEIWEERDKNDV